jgi:hypothetical protein
METALAQKPSHRSYGDRALLNTLKINSMRIAPTRKQNVGIMKTALAQKPNHRHHEGRTLPETQAIDDMKTAPFLKP